METNTQANAGGTSVCFILFVVFLVLKLTHVIAWSWWWVTAPLWIGAIISIVSLIVFGIVLKVITSKSKSRF